SMEASMKTLYDLVDPSNQKTKEWLKNTVVIIDPCINPDGRDRYANFYYQYGNRIPNPDPMSKEHREVWPGGRPNHYLFDLNRDWAWLKQTESIQRLERYHAWMPHVHVDFHEQGVNSPYYFAPAAEPYHQVITPWQREFQTLIGKNNAKYFDKNNWLYFTREVFDLYYPSYGDTYPMYNGSIGMTFEQGGSGRAGLTVTTELEDELTLKDRIAHHYSNGLSTIEVSSLHAQKVVEEFTKYFKNNISNPEGQFKTYLIKGTNHPDKINALADFLTKHKIEFGYSAASKKALSSFSFTENKEKSITPSSMDLVVNIYQSKSRLITAFFDAKATLPDSLTYDITGWALPYVFGVEVYGLKEKIAVGTPFKPIVNEPGKAETAPYAYILTYKSFADAQFLSYVQQRKIKVRSTEKPFVLSGQQFDRGSLILTRRNNEGLGEDFDRIIREGTALYNRNTLPVYTGLSDTGVDLGSNNINYIPAPKVAVLSGNQVSSLSFGEVWYFMEQELNYPVTILDTDYIQSVDLNQYDVFIIPPGYYNLFDESMLNKLGEWVSRGGRLIAIGNALRSFSDKDGFGLKQYKDDKEKEAMKNSTDNTAHSIYGDRERNSISEEIIGAIYPVIMDNTHPLGYGYDKLYYSLKTSGTRYSYLENGWNVGTLDKGVQPVSGFAGYLANKQMSESLVFGVYPKGQGKIIYFVDNPLFRAFWENGKLLMSNALFMAGQ
ncbi:MAG: M14 family metallopeptidase, partial [Cyclobacteriaceae bacterium]|nr:M14 family metallopeptidase [Cyclobacteriaceae bacterium]